MAATATHLKRHLLKDRDAREQLREVKQKLADAKREAGLSDTLRRDLDEAQQSLNGRHRCDFCGVYQVGLESLAKHLAENVRQGGGASTDDTKRLRERVKQLEAELESSRREATGRAELADKLRLQLDEAAERLGEATERIQELEAGSMADGAQVEIRRLLDGGWTQRDIAIAIDTYQGSVSRWKRGKCGISEENLAKLRALPDRPNGGRTVDLPDASPTWRPTNGDTDSSAYRAAWEDACFFFGLQDADVVDQLEAIAERHGIQ